MKLGLWWARVWMVTGMPTCLKVALRSAMAAAISWLSSRRSLASTTSIPTPLCLCNQDSSGHGRDTLGQQCADKDRELLRRLAVAEAAPELHGGRAGARRPRLVLALSSQPSAFLRREGVRGVKLVTSWG